MKGRALSSGAVVFAILIALPALADSTNRLQLQMEGAKARLSWPTAMELEGQGAVLPEYRLFHTTDLIHWTSFGGKIRGVQGRSGPMLNVLADLPAQAGFFRLMADLQSAAANESGNGGAEVFGYGAQLSAELDRVGFPSADEFERRAGPAQYLPALTWDPTQALYWTNFARWLPLRGSELAAFKTNGFVVRELAPETSFGGVYGRIFHSDLPVFVTSDSILQAWHRNYLAMLEETEEAELATLMELVVTNMAAGLPQVWAEFGQGPLGNSILDADYFLTVARSLWAAVPVKSSLNAPGQDLLVTNTLAAIARLSAEYLPLYGGFRLTDFSQFKVRGHYTNSERLSRYFKTMMWCGRTDLRLATFPPNEEDDIRQLGTAVVLHALLKASGQYTNWLAVEQVTRAFVGVTDSMTFAQMDELLSGAGIRTLADVPDLLTLTNLQTRLLSGEFGTQAIIADAFFSPMSSEQVKMPRSFTFFGQKFVLDSWAMSQVVFDRVLWPQSSGEGTVFGKVIRRKPSGIDIAFSVFGNSQTAPAIARRIRDTNGVPFRDGLPYQHNLLALKTVIDGQQPAAWTDNIYNAWLGALRALSEPTTGPEYPEAMRTEAWAMKTLTTQVGSWTQLRHDTLLYVKQSYTPMLICSYPFGYVEPRPEFWNKMKLLARTASAVISTLPLPLDQVTLQTRRPSDGSRVTWRLEEVKQKQLAALAGFEEQMDRLEAMAAKELAQIPFNAEEEDLLKSIIEEHGVCSPGEPFSGWYPALFYKNLFWPTNVFGWEFQIEDGCGRPDALVTDVHTDMPDPIVGDPGAVIHEGIGSPFVLLIAVDNGPDRMMFAGPVFSYYEFEMPAATRMSDQEWSRKFEPTPENPWPPTGQAPPVPEWSRCYQPGQL